MILTRRATKLALVFTAATAAPALAQTAGSPKIAYVDSKIILSRAPGRQAAEDTFNKEMEASRTQVQKMGDSLQTMIADYQKVQATLAANIREQRESAIRKKQEDYQTRAGALDQQMQQRQMELVKPIMDQIRKVLDDIRQEEGYAFILDAGSDAGVIVAADRNLDITEKVIARLKPIPVTASAPSSGAAKPATSPATTKPDSAKTPLGPRSAPAGVTRPKP
jgi:outer membrane protein